MYQNFSICSSLGASLSRLLRNQGRASDVTAGLALFVYPLCGTEVRSSSSSPELTALVGDHREFHENGIEFCMCKCMATWYIGLV